MAKKDNMSMARHLITLFIGAVTAWAVTTATLKAHIENNYVHKDIMTLEQTFVRKDVQAVQLDAIIDDLQAIKRELGIQ